MSRVLGALKGLPYSRSHGCFGPYFSQAKTTLPSDSFDIGV